jgi:hypothetical protein
MALTLESRGLQRRLWLSKMARLLLAYKPPDMGLHCCEGYEGPPVGAPGAPDQPLRSSARHTSDGSTHRRAPRRRQVDHGKRTGAGAREETKSEHPRRNAAARVLTRDVGPEGRNRRAAISHHLLARPVISPNRFYSPSSIHPCRPFPSWDVEYK